MPVHPDEFYIDPNAGLPFEEQTEDRIDYQSQNDYPPVNGENNGEDIYATTEQLEYKDARTASKTNVSLTSSVLRQETYAIA